MARVEVPVSRGTADVVIAVFNDYQCSSCSVFHRTMEQAIERLSGEERTRVVWRMVDFPLDGSCNPSIKSARHESACEAAIAARLARLFGREREFSSWLFDHADALTTEAIWLRAESLGIKRTSVAYETALGQVRSDVAIGLELGVKATPTIFINGARFHGSPDLEALLVVVRHELATVPSRRK
jgi:protein-disulfide isomerase